ncbi:MAG: hypothetical protein JWL68_567 [Actinomycetia bacterium]|nr:hypothetical protein [Actinomycetes bacterium]
MAAADRENRILVSADTDFGELLANAPVLAPSVILLRRTDKQARSLAAVILANLEQITDDLAAGALIVISDTISAPADSPWNHPTDECAPPPDCWQPSTRLRPRLGCHATCYRTCR